MERAADIETQRAFGARLFGERHGALDAVHVTTDDDLARRVVVGGNDGPRLARGRLAHGLDWHAELAKNRRHRSRPASAALVHELTASPNDAKRIVERQCASRMIRSELAEGVTGRRAQPA